MRQSLKALYTDAAQEFARRVVRALGSEVDSVVLFGSAARGEAKRTSDIDILVISPRPETIKDCVSEIRSDLAYESNFSFFVSLVHLSRQDLYRVFRLGSPFVWELTKQGVVLYDNGTFARVREQAIAASRRSS